MGSPGNRGSWGLCVLAHAQSTPKEAYKKVPGHFTGPPTDPSSQMPFSHMRSGHPAVKPQAVTAGGGLTTHGAPGQ
ncbi:unnamed protein product [Staurois parvus]|uniref:Uncharacterized protein n=1 Tax=Staurois parvus TaxID=386267 RepID=A0ABN9EGP5_9NEOB|nr:unnamed protein product [Staurois parvus]